MVKKNDFEPNDEEEDEFDHKEGVDHQKNWNWESGKNTNWSEDDFDQKEDDRDDVDNIEIDIDIGELLIFNMLSSIGISSISTTTFFHGLIIGGVFSLPFTGTLALTNAIFDRHQHQQQQQQQIQNAVKPRFFREIGRDMSKRSLFFGVFCGSYSAISNFTGNDPDNFEMSDAILAGVPSISLATISYRKPRLVLPGVALLLAAGYIGLVP